MNLLMCFAVLLSMGFGIEHSDDNTNKSCFLEKEDIQKGDTCVLSDVGYYPFSSAMTDRVRTYCDSIISFLAERDLKMVIEIAVIQACEEELTRSGVGSRAKTILEYVESKGLDNISFEANGYRHGIPAEEFSTLDWEEIKTYSKIIFKIIDVVE